MVPLNENQLMELLNVEGSTPMSLSDYADRKECFGGWVYDRKYGMILVDFAHHIFVMANLLAFHKGYDSLDEMMDDRGYSMRYKFREWSDEYLRTYPSVYGSFAGGDFSMFKSKNTKLTEFESDVFGLVSTIKV